MDESTRVHNFSMERLPTPDQADAVSSREELVAYVKRVHDALASGTDVEIPTTDRFLDALGAWLQASPAWYRNTGRSYSDEPTWSSFAHALSAALIYE